MKINSHLSGILKTGFFFFFFNSESRDAKKITLRSQSLNLSAAICERHFLRAGFPFFLFSFSPRRRAEASGGEMVWIDATLSSLARGVFLEALRSRPHPRAEVSFPKGPVARGPAPPCVAATGWPSVPKHGRKSERSERETGCYFSPHQKEIASGMYFLFLPRGAR